MPKQKHRPDTIPALSLHQMPTSHQTQGPRLMNEFKMVCLQRHCHVTVTYCAHYVWMKNNTQWSQLFINKLNTSQIIAIEITNVRLVKGWGLSIFKHRCLLVKTPNIFFSIYFFFSIFLILILFFNCVPASYSRPNSYSHHKGKNS